MKNEQKTRIRWGEGRLAAAALGLMLVLCLLTAMNRLPQKTAAQPVHCVEADLYDHVRVDLNTAGREALMELPNIGETIADRIIAARPYSSVDDLIRVDGIGEGTLAQLRPLVKVS